MMTPGSVDYRKLSAANGVVSRRWLRGFFPRPLWERVDRRREALARRVRVTASRYVATPHPARITCAPPSPTRGKGKPVAPIQFSNSKYSVIPRACGVSSTPRILDSIADASEYWIVRSSRTTTGYESAFPRRQRARVLPERCPSNRATVAVWTCDRPGSRLACATASGGFGLEPVRSQVQTATVALVGRDGAR
jgi:hypothetical protein